MARIGGSTKPRAMADCRCMFKRTQTPIEEWAYGKGAKRPYTQLPPGHPDYDAEDHPILWRRVLAEAIGGITLAAIVLAVTLLAQPLGPTLPRFLDWLSGLL